MEKDNLISMSLNPGSLRTQLLRHTRSWLHLFLHYFMLYDAINGAYALLFAGLSPGVELKDSGRYVIPFGRFGENRDDLIAAMKIESEGGTGGAKRFWEYCEKETSAYV